MENRMKSLLKSSLISAVFAAGALASIPAQADDPEIDTATDLYKKPSCDYNFTIKSLLSNISKQEPTGIVASNKDWDMEIYQNKIRGDWALVGKSKATDANPRKLCILVRGSSTNSYSTQKWYTANFEKDVPNAAADKTQPRPSVN